LLPQQTFLNSPFYTLNTLQVGAQAFIDWNGTRYAYQVEKKFDASSAADATRPSTDAKMTLFASDASGKLDDKTVFEAKLIGTVAWVKGQQPFIDRGTKN
jgi:sortase (surface protein transpeptidase)